MAALNRAAGAPESSGWGALFVLRVGLLVYAVFVTYGSLVPMHLARRTVQSAWEAFCRLPLPTFDTGDRSDWAVNFLLLMPLAFGLRQLYVGRASGAVALLRTVLMAALLLAFSLTIEFAQMFFPPRTSSLNDVAAQFAGTLTAFALQMRYGAAFGRWLQAFSGLALRQSRVTTMLAAYLALLLAFSVMPLDLTISPVEIYRKWRDGRVILVPFGEPVRELGEWVYGLLTDVVLWMPVGLLWSIDGSRRSLRAVLGKALLASTLIEFAQLFVLSRFSDVTDILLSVLGAFGGAMLARTSRYWSSVDPLGLVRVLWLCWWLWLAGLLLLLWFPFDFALWRLLGPEFRGAFFRMPFETYFYRSEFGALNEMLRKVLLFLPGGLLLGLVARGAIAGRPPVWAAWVLLAIAMVVETGQVMLPGRVGDLTDVALEVAGGLLGLRLAVWLTAVPKALQLAGQGASK